MLAPCLQDRFNLGPKVREKRCGVGVGVEADSLSCVLVVELDARLGPWAAALANRMGVVEPEQTVAMFVMQRERVIQAVRSLGGFWNFLDHKLDPAFSVSLRDESLAIEKEQGVEAGVVDFI